MQNTKEIANLIRNSKSIAVVPSSVAGADAFCAAVGVYYMLLEKDKEVTFVYNRKVPEEAEGLIEKDRIQNNITNRELVVKIDYKNTPASNATYNTLENDVLEIRLNPIPKDFELDRVKARIEGAEFDLIFVVGAQGLEDLGSELSNIKNEFKDAKVINLDNTSINTNFGDLDVVDSKAESLSSLVFKYASEWDLVPNEKGAKALLIGMTYRNGNFGIDNQ